MNSLRLIDRRAGVLAIAFAMLLATVASAFASAAQISTRSIALSSSSAGAEEVSYQIKFTSVQSAGAFAVQFCSNTPLIGEACTKPGGLDLTAAASTTSGFTDVTAVDDDDDNIIVVAGTINATTAITVDVTDIVNPSAAGTMYARIVTYDTKAHALDYTDTVLGSGVRDQGSVALAITPTIAVSGAVLENLQFCVARVTITADCGDAGALNHEPTLVLGEDVGSGIIALTPSNVSTGVLYTQLSTNAVGGAVVSLKSNAPCGGLMLGGTGACHIAAAETGGIANGEAKFGLKTAASSTGTGDHASGLLQAVSPYNSSTYALEATGVSSTYGDAFLNTNGQTANNQNMAVTFGASIANNTPGGKYSAELSMIATGTF